MQRVMIENEAAKRPQELDASDVDVLLGSLKVNKLGDAVALANLNVDELLKDNATSADFISSEMARAETMLRAKQNVRAAEAALRQMIEANRQKGVLADTEEIKELRAKIDATKGLRVGEEVDETALAVINFREFYREVQETAEKARGFLKGTKEEADVGVDALADKYYSFFKKLWGNRNVQEVPVQIIREWKVKHVSFSDYAFSVKNHEGKRIWCWGIKGDEKSMAIAKAMRHLYISLDRLISKLEKANQPKPSDAPVAASTQE
ncbi:MAG: hypothetical protein Q7S12_01725 [bacterium]|nr:hypothetical protein [bacterium]